MFYIFYYCYALHKLFFAPATNLSSRDLFWKPGKKLYHGFIIPLKYTIYRLFKMPLIIIEDCSRNIERISSKCYDFVNESFR